jgi:U3 small nucleolar RNA-associated protein 18
LRNANHQSPTTGKQEASNGGSGVVDLAWHPSERVGVLAVAGGDRRIRFFNVSPFQWKNGRRGPNEQVDGHTNPSLMTLHIPSLPLLKSTFHPTGSSILFTGPRPYYYTYDLASQRCLRSARNLFGSVPDPTSPNSLVTHKFSPDGAFLAVAGRRGAVSVLDWSNVGVGAVVADLRSGRGGAVTSLDWSLDGKELSVLGGRDGAEVEVWNVGERKVVRKWRDDRAFGGMVMQSSRGGDYTAIGYVLYISHLNIIRSRKLTSRSSTGIVNVYSSSSLRAGPDPLEIRPNPLKSLEHLTTSITTLAFHPSSELLVTASKTRRDQLKLVCPPVPSFRHRGDSDEELTTSTTYPP